MEGKLNLPEFCGECNCLLDYMKNKNTENPEYCCKLIWSLFEEKHIVNPEVLDEKCPFRNEKFKEAYKELYENF